MGYKIKQNSQRVESSKIKFIKNKVWKYFVVLWLFIIANIWQFYNIPLYWIISQSLIWVFVEET